MHTIQRTIFAILLAGAVAACGQGDAGPSESSEAALIRYDWSVVNVEGEPTNVSVTQYAIIGQTSGYVLSMSAATETAVDYEEVFRQIAESFVEEPT